MSMTPPLRVAIIGTGPSGFYAAEHLLKQHSGIEIDFFDRLPTPFGLVRGGVAPDHEKIKSVTRIYEKIAGNPAVRFFGHVLIGTDLSREDLLRHYHAVIYACGAQSDRSLGVPGEELAGSHAATDFVGWFNGHPDYGDCRFDLSQVSVAVIGMGNVAVDVVRILARTPEELQGTDIAGHALAALRESRVRDIYMIGRRGPVQAAFTNPELKELGEMAGADIDVRASELDLDPASAGVLAGGGDKAAEKNLETLRSFAARPPARPRPSLPGWSFARLAISAPESPAFLSIRSGGSSPTTGAASSRTRRRSRAANTRPDGSSADPAGSSAPTSRMRWRPASCCWRTFRMGR
jgi:ferredoxin--NADP+ reductase